VANKWFVPRKTYEIAQENAQKINKRRLELAEENKTLQENILALVKENQELINKCTSLEKQVRQLKKITKTNNTDEKSKRTRTTKKTPKKEAE